MLKTKTKRLLSIFFVMLLLLSLTSCKKEAEYPFTFSSDYEPVKYENFVDFGNNVIYFEVTEDLTSTMLDRIATNYDGWPGGCTSLANINSKGELIIGRNNDNEISEYPIYVSMTSGGKYKTFNVYYCSDGAYTYNDLLEMGQFDNTEFDELGRPIKAFASATLVTETK